MNNFIVKISVLALFLTVAVALVGVSVAEESKPAQTQYSKQTMEIFGHGFTLDFPSYMERHKDDFYTWEEVGFLIPEAIPEFRDKDASKSIYDVGRMLHLTEQRYLDLHRDSLYKMAETVIDNGHFSIIASGVTKDFDPFNLLERVDTDLPYKPKQEQIDYLAARFGTWINRNENWKKYVEDYNAGLDEDTVPVDPNALWRSQRWYKTYVAARSLKELIGGSPEYQAFLKEYNAQKDSPSPSDQ